MKKIIFFSLISLALPIVGNATYTQQYTLSQDTVFQNQITVAEIQTSVAVLAEAANTTGHLARASFAAQVIQNPAKWSPIIAIIIGAQNNNAMTPLTVPSTVSDALIQTAMNAQWTNMSGYFNQ